MYREGERCKTELVKSLCEVGEKRSHHFSVIRDGSMVSETSTLPSLFVNQERRRDCLAHRWDANIVHSSQAACRAFNGAVDFLLLQVRFQLFTSTTFVSEQRLEKNGSSFDTCIPIEVRIVYFFTRRVIFDSLDLEADKLVLVALQDLKTEKSLEAPSTHKPDYNYAHYSATNTNNTRYGYALTYACGRPNHTLEHRTVHRTRCPCFVRPWLMSTHPQALSFLQFASWKQSHFEGGTGDNNEGPHVEDEEEEERRRDRTPNRERRNNRCKQIN
ncbi:uncharacterized protein MYCFIDRAFT_179902 [Pseudocercospora fijiensis CIRAD86]|uniref:Uncharacterized protein n=1 Tax=Pseudocercospora fijiensis (strain CIRAD86) TaxID=383855 RepID=M2YHQ4_PSEFD|nr:uncharacterized protein MYCFIDRAFT_179902 [Pseudocercospora fijiensis CIRAD86]EME77325.1 hypothetical protein MYCFIDRAFT_179902 [Pseudocercospora fijiensis CIRAD86]